ncbi:MAG: hypothetical protein FWH18_02525 [Marinilabiliaceae bacterium]|nr:hypothetical protein [Marinilabiliaceae bacterium]
MRILQTIYTSCRIGQTGSAGFQFYSFSEGITKEELLEIERIGNYSPPQNLPTNPTKEELDEKFPISFNYFKLKSGRVGILQSVPLQSDYSGRPGNFFAHAFIIETGEFPYLPILLYNSTAFKTILTKEEENIQTIPDKLPVIDIDFLTKNLTLSLENVIIFLQNAQQKKILEKFINAAILNSETNRKIIICDSHENSIFWIAAILFAFPLQLSKSLTFSTYSIDPANNYFAIAATVPNGNKFDFYNQIAYTNQYFIFNFDKNKISPIDYSSIYGEAVSTYLLADHSKLDKISTVFEILFKQKIDKDIDFFYKLFADTEEYIETPNFLHHLIEKFESNINLSKLHEHNFINFKEICILKEKNGIKTNSNISEISALLIELEKKEKTNILLIFKEMNFDLSNMPEKDFLCFCELFFSYIVPLIKNEEDFFYIFLFIVNCNTEQSFQKLENALVSHVEKNNENLSKIIYLLQFATALEKYEIVQKDEIEDFTKNVLSKLNKTTIKRLKKRITKKKEVNIEKCKNFYSKMKHFSLWQRLMGKNRDIFY